MNQAQHSLTRSLLYGVILSLLLSSCSRTPVESAPPILQPNPIANVDGNYINIVMDSLEFMGDVSNLGDTGNLQLIMVVSDDSGHSDALICPYGGVIPVHTGDKINPCKAGLTYPKNIVQGNLNIMLIAMDVKNQSDLADMGTNVITSGLSTGLATAIQGTRAMTPKLAIGLIALSAIVGYAGTKTQEYFERNYVIGSQSFTMSSEDHWNDGQPVSALSADERVVFAFTVQESSIAVGQIVETATIESTIPSTPSHLPEESITLPNEEPWLYNINSVPDNTTELSWHLNAGEVLLLTGGRILFNDYYCGDNAAQICVIIVTATEDQTVNFSRLIAGQNWLGITNTFDSEQALSNIEPWFWRPPNCGNGCSMATIAFYIDLQPIEVRTSQR